MQKGQHIGKIIVNPAEKLDDLPTEATSDIILCSDSSYLLTGGLGGLGRVISIWMVERGAKHLILLSRCAGKYDDGQSFMHELQPQGCNTRPLLGTLPTRS